MANVVQINGRSFDLTIDANDYWRKRMHNDPYCLTVCLAQSIFPDATSAIDVGCYTSGIIVDLDWIKRRVASDINQRLAANWSHAEGVEFISGGAFQLGFEEKFDLVISNQTIEHVEDPPDFVANLLALGRGLIISTTYETPHGLIEGHIQDPISLEKLRGWFPVELDTWIICHHPTNRKVRHITAAIRQSHAARKR